MKAIVTISGSLTVRSEIREFLKRFRTEKSLALTMENILRRNDISLNVERIEDALAQAKHERKPQLVIEFLEECRNRENEIKKADEQVALQNDTGWILDL
ncbi:hypothetical protein [Vibrio phage vB_VmeM-Yong XC32]|nr:hypothetical protein [Vibrio phage vB_VmeM-Yong XC31]QAX96430.1 hypothetical protein [Vibrio phage vB_VmeM-Yong XC32]QAX96747.1 hypothetical protein [Vibrio phage vB_VmeM-Yong MS31]QAX97066.1 hypothetical protein [Vibrio phage vB_VmeM-Yong MS32]